MRAYYDLHLHSCLSPCGDNDMTPNNIVGMAKLLGLNMIALTDHNSCLNCEAVMEVGKKQGLTVIPGIELTTSEEIHAVCLFDTLENALSFNRYVAEHQMQIKNRTDIYGEQLILDENDEIKSEVDNLLILATDISIMNVYSLVKSYGGVCFPAHIDRDSMSMLSVLGEIPPECGFKTAELSKTGDYNALSPLHPILESLNIVSDSDAHRLEDMKDAKPYIELESLSAENLIKALDSDKSAGKPPVFF